MAKGAADLRALSNCSGSVFHSKAPACGRFGKYRPLQLRPMAGLTIARRSPAVLEYRWVSGNPALIDRMHSMRALHPAVCIEVSCKIGGGKSVGPMAGNALYNLARVSLKLTCSQVVVGIRYGVGPFRMSASVTAFAEHTAVSFAQAE